MRLALNGEHHALIDDADAWVAQWRWTWDGRYVHRMAGGRKHRHKVYLHRLLLGLESGDRRMGEHKNRNRLDNTRENLRIATRGDLDNKQNLDPYANNTTGYRGVTRRGSRYIAQCMLNYRQHYLGLHDTAEEADAVVRAFRAEHMPFSEDAAA